MTALTMPRDTQATSLQAYDDLQPSMAQRRRAVLVGLERYVTTRGTHPTAYELLQFMADLAIGGVRDVNSVRPRLTELKASGEVVVDTARRRCSVTGKAALTWRVADGRLF